MTDAQLLQAPVEALVAGQPADARVAQVAVEVLVAAVNDAVVFQHAVEVLVEAAPPAGVSGRAGERRMGVWQPDVPCLTL